MRRRSGTASFFDPIPKENSNDFLENVYFTILFTTLPTDLAFYIFSFIFVQYRNESSLSKPLISLISLFHPIWIAKHSHLAMTMIK